MRVSVETAKVGLEQRHQDPASAREGARVLQLVRLDDGIDVGVVRVRAGQHLLHLELRPRAVPDNPPCPVVDGVALLAPVLVGGIPRPARLEAEGSESERGHVQAHALDVARQVWMARVAPVLARTDRDDLAGHRLPQPAAPQGNRAVGAEETAPGGPLLDG